MPITPFTPARLPTQYLRPMEIFPDVRLLMHPPIPPSLWGVNPRNLFGSDWWTIVRKRTYELYDRRCWACGVPAREAIYRPGRLDAHETYHYEGVYRRATFAGTVALCLACHEFIHRGRMKTLLLKGKIGASKVDKIITRGMEMLAAVDLRPPQTHLISDFHRDGWTLVIDDTTYRTEDLMRVRGKTDSGVRRKMRSVRQSKKYRRHVNRKRR